MFILQIALGVGLGIVVAYLLIKYFREAFAILVVLAILAAVIFALYFVFSSVNLSWKKLWNSVLIFGGVGLFFAVFMLIASILMMLCNTFFKRLPTLKLFIDGTGAYSGFKWLVLRLLVLPFIAVIVVLIPLSICYLGYMAITAIL